MIQKTLVKANAFVVEVQEDMISGTVMCWIHTRVYPGSSDAFDYIIAKEPPPCLVSKPDRNNQNMVGNVIKFKKA